MKRIEKLTSAQEALMPVVRDEWLAIGLSTAPADRPMAERGIRMAYEIAGLAAPRVIWCGSPLGNALTRYVVLGFGEKLTTSGASVGDSVGASVGASVGDSVGASVWDSVGDSVWASVRASVGDSVGASVYGQHDAAWLAFYDFFARMGLQEQTQKLGGLWLIGRSANWWLPHQHICWVSERPNRLERDDRGRLHSGDGMAIRYPDGWGIYAWHGVRVPARVILHAPTLTSEEILSEPNAEIRRVMVERVGYERFLGLTQARRIQADDYGELFKIELRGDEPVVLVRVLNSTPEPDGSRKPYLLRVPPQIERARDAVAWSFDVPSAEYAPAQQT